MISIKKVVFLATLSLFATVASAQYITVDENQTVEQLVQDVLIDNACANVSNISVNGLAINAGTSIGYFSAGTSNFPFADGIILSTGLAASAPGPNSGILSEG